MTCTECVLALQEALGPKVEEGRCGKGWREQEKKGGRTGSSRDENIVRLFGSDRGEECQECIRGQRCIRDEARESRLARICLGRRMLKLEKHLGGD